MQLGTGNRSKAVVGATLKMAVNKMQRSQKPPTVTETVSKSSDNQLRFLQYSQLRINAWANYECKEKAEKYRWAPLKLSFGKG